MQPTVPDGWSVVGGLPSPDFDTAALQDLGEDILQIVTPRGEFTIDVGWYEQCDSADRYWARLVSDSDWQYPLEEFRSARAESINGWVTQQIENVRLVLGEPGVIQDAAVNRIVVEYRHVIEEQIGAWSSRESTLRAKSNTANVLSEKISLEHAA